MCAYSNLNKIINLRENEKWEECVKEIVAFSTQIEMPIPVWAKEFLSLNDKEKNNLVSEWLIDANNHCVGK